MFQYKHTLAIYVYTMSFSRHKERIENMIGKRLIWERKTSKGSAKLNLNISFSHSDMTNWDDICNEIIPNAILMKQVFSHF